MHGTPRPPRQAERLPDRDVASDRGPRRPGGAAAVRPHRGSRPRRWTARRACCRSGPVRPRARTVRRWRRTAARAPAGTPCLLGRPTTREHLGRTPSSGPRGSRRPSPPWSAGRAPNPARGTRPPLLVIGVDSASAPGSALPVGLPPTAGDPRRSAMSPSLLQAGWPTDSAAPPATRCAGPTACSTSCPCSGAGHPAEGQDQDDRGVPRHVRMVPGDHGQPVAARMRPRGAEEVVPVEQRGLARRRSAGRQGDHAAYRPGRSFVVDLADGQHPLAVRRGAQPAVSVHLARPEAPRSAPRARPARPGRPAPSQNHTRWSAWST